MTDDMNSRIRRAAGRQTPQELAAEQAGDASALRERITAEAGLPVRLAARLKGDDAGALAEDARQLAEALGELKPAAPSMSDRIRLAAGRAPAPTVGESGAENDVVSFDGGARRPGPPPPPSMGSLMRGELAARRERRAELAEDFDQLP